MTATLVFSRRIKWAAPWLAVGLLGAALLAPGCERGGGEGAKGGAGGDGKKGGTESPAPRAARDPATLSETELKDETKTVLRETISWLREARLDDGLWGAAMPGKKAESNAGLTALALKAVLYAKGPGNLGGNALDVPWVRDGVEQLVKWQQPDGSIFLRDNANYTTSLAVQALALADAKKYGAQIDRARDYLLKCQYDEDGENAKEDNRHYGGAGYGKGRETPDLNNTCFWIDALARAGVAKEHPAFQKALTYLSRCQNDSDRNPAPVEVDADGDGQPDQVSRSNDGGASYRPGENPKEVGYEKGADGTWRTASYGNMTYSLLSSYLTAGLSKEDPRMQKAWAWVAKRFTVETHPGLKDDPRHANAGYYYYLCIMAHALRLYGVEEITDGQGVVHRWRPELARRVLAIRAKEGHWVNANNAWMEGLPVISTSYVLMALTDVLSGW
ncbi:MAG: terpene cyclase/mutase family protein [Planctomycetes bacterium]|nr:terpene cyclase/mutase family protein [Planctomycetota bacterium]